MGRSLLFVALLAATSRAEMIPRSAALKQEGTFRRWWDSEFVWKFDDLPARGELPRFRVPYSGYIYPDTQGGTAAVLKKYDRAFRPGRDQTASSWETWDTTAYKEPAKGLFGILGMKRVPDWHGHCNGWTAAAIRHAEPREDVVYNGVRFTPADIKALLAEIYIYNDTEMLSGFGQKLNAGTFHAILANWIGRGLHPLGMEKDPGKEKWNYPIYGYASSYAKHSPRKIEVNTNVIFARDSEDREYDESPRLYDVLLFHYILQLDGDGEITGGYFFPDSAKIEMLWVPLSPKQPEVAGNENGNPHVDVQHVLSLWRSSVPEEERLRWITIDPLAEDRIVTVAEPNQLLPRDVEFAVQMVDREGTSAESVPSPVDLGPSEIADSADLTTLEPIPDPLPSRPIPGTPPPPASEGEDEDEDELQYTRWLD